MRSKLADTSFFHSCRFKIAVAGAINDTAWFLEAQRNKDWNFTIPATTPPGKYLLRHEQFMPSPYPDGTTVRTLRIQRRQGTSKEDLLTSDSTRAPSFTSTAPRSMSSALAEVSLGFGFRLPASSSFSSSSSSSFFSFFSSSVSAYRLMMN
jgi:hypothetical protein